MRREAGRVGRIRGAVAGGDVLIQKENAQSNRRSGRSGCSSSTWGGDSVVLC